MSSGEYCLYHLCKSEGQEIWCNCDFVVVVVIMIIARNIRFVGNNLHSLMDRFLTKIIFFYSGRNGLCRFTFHSRTFLSYRDNTYCQWLSARLWLCSSPTVFEEEWDSRWYNINGYHLLFFNVAISMTIEFMPISINYLYTSIKKNIPILCCLRVSSLTYNSQ